MKCLAVGDMLIPKTYFDKELSGSELFDQYSSLSWHEDEDKKTARDTIRKIETFGSEAFPVTEEILEEARDADVLAVHLCPVPKELIEQSGNLRYILSCRGGLENIDLDACRERGITVINCPAHNAYAVAEITVGLILCEMRNLARSNKALVTGVWREEYPNSECIHELRSSKIGIIGFGTIGRLVAERLKAFGSKILVYDPFVPAEAIESLGCSPLGKAELLREADVITLHGRIGPNDPPIIGKEELEQMKPSAYLINTARAVLVDMDALYAALKNRTIRGAALDVYQSEPLPDNFPFLKLDNVTLTNHRGGATIESYIKAPEMVINQFKELLEKGDTRFRVRL